MSGPLVEFEVPGHARPQGSKSVTKKGVMYDANRGLKPWRALVTAHAMRAWRRREPLTGPLSLRVVFALPRPRSHYRTGRNVHLLRDGAPQFPHARGTGDVEKLVRAVSDSLTDAHVIVDDCIIVHDDAWKVYAAPGRVGARISLWPVPHPAGFTVEGTMVLTASGEVYAVATTTARAHQLAALLSFPAPP